MRKYIRNIFLNNFKSIFFMLLNSNSRYFDIEKIELKFKKDCKLGKKNTTFSTKVDEMITPYILRSGEWEYFVIEYIKKILIGKNQKFVFIDVGANIGLTSKQLINQKLKISKYFCIEPEESNFELLKKNLGNIKKVVFYNLALTNKYINRQKIYLNKNNFGDYSLLKKSTISKIVKCMNINLFFRKVEKKYNINNVIYKSDTQGLDEILIMSLEKKYFNKIKILILEISNFDFLGKNLNAFLNLITNFKNIEDENGDKIDKNKLLSKIYKKKGFNLFLSRN